MKFVVYIHDTTGFLLEVRTMDTYEEAQEISNRAIDAGFSTRIDQE